MNRVKRRLAALVMAAFLGTAVWAEAGPAPLPVQIPIRDIHEPATPDVSARPFVSRPARTKTRRAKPVRRHRRPDPPKAARPAPAPAPAAQAGPKLEQRYEAPTESIMVPPAPAAASNPKPGAAEFPPQPEPAPAPAPAKP